MSKASCPFQHNSFFVLQSAYRYLSMTSIPAEKGLVNGDAWERKKSFLQRIFNGINATKCFAVVSVTLPNVVNANFDGSNE